MCQFRALFALRESNSLIISLITDDENRPENSGFQCEYTTQIASHSKTNQRFMAKEIRNAKGLAVDACVMETRLKPKQQSEKKSVNMNASATMSFDPHS